MKILEEYDATFHIYDNFRLKSEQLIKELIGYENIDYHQITSRTKNRNSLFQKLEKKEKYTKLNEITDIVGIRIITYFEDEVDSIASMIEREFDVDKSNSIDKRELENDRFGYKSLHYVASLSFSRLHLTEFKTFEFLKMEVQIRTILQHSWAEIEHDIGYKGDITIPNFAKRAFYRVAALLETADSEFLKLKNNLKEYENKIPELIQNSPSKVLLDAASLKSFILNNDLLKHIAEDEAERINLKIHWSLDQPESEPFIEGLLNMLDRMGLKTIKELNDRLKSKETELRRYLKDGDILNNMFSTHFSIGAPLHFLERV